MPIDFMIHFQIDFMLTISIDFMENFQINQNIVHFMLNHLKSQTQDIFVIFTRKSLFELAIKSLNY